VKKNAIQTKFWLFYHCTFSNKLCLEFFTTSIDLPQHGIEKHQESIFDRFTCDEFAQLHN
jgi:hypothetical protein